MSLSILGGLLKGHKLFLPSNQIVRPTAASLKRKVFDAFQNFDGATFVDLCSGSGSIGIEAWSRGAGQVYCIEGNKKAHSTLSKNCELAKKHYSEEFVLRPIRPIFSKVERWVTQNFSVVNSDQVIIYLDPPYDKKSIYEKVIEQLKKCSFKGELWLESCSQKGMSPAYWTEMFSSHTFKVYEQGSAYIIRFRFAE